MKLDNAAATMAKARWGNKTDAEKREHAFKMLAGRKDRDSKGYKVKRDNAKKP